MASDDKIAGRKPVRGRPGKGRDKDQGAPSPRSVPLTQQIGRIAVAIVAVLFGVFAVVNAQPVAFDWVFGETAPRTVEGEHVGGGVPLIALLVVSFLAGSLVAWFSMWWWTRHRDTDRPGAK